MVYLGAYASVLLLFYKRADARVISYSRDPEGIIRQGDWRLRYEFQAEGGRTYVGEATFPPRNRPPEGIRTVTVRYVPLTPNISGVEGNISATGLGGFVMAGILIWNGLSALAKSRVAEPGAPPNGGPAERLGHSGTGCGPPSVS
jgi:hypothetical protein